VIAVAAGGGIDVVDVVVVAAAAGAVVGTDAGPEVVIAVAGSG